MELPHENLNLWMSLGKSASHSFFPFLLYTEIQNLWATTDSAQLFASSLARSRATMRSLTHSLLSSRNPIAQVLSLGLVIVLKKVLVISCEARKNFLSAI